MLPLPDDLIAFISIIAIDILLGGDNAVVIALASRNLPESKRNKAILLGTGLAVILRAGLTILVVYLLQIPLLHILGGFLLIFIAYTLLVDKPDSPHIHGSTSTVRAVQTIVFADLIMGLDNVLAVAGAARGEIYLVVIGLLVSVPIIIWGSKLILRVMNRFPAFIYVGSGILVFTAARMITNAPQFKPFFSENPRLALAAWVMAIFVILTSGWMTNQTRANR